MSDRRQRLASALAVLVLTLPFAACELATASFRAEARNEWSKNFPIAASGRFELQNTNGAIEVEPAEGAEIQVRAEKVAKAATEEAARQMLEEIEIVVTQTGDRVRLETKYPKGWNRGGEVKYWVKVPSTVAVHVENTNGRIALANLRGLVDASTTNGGVSGRDLLGPVRASTTNGGVDIVVGAVHPEGIELSTTNGGVSLRLPGSAKADISARCTNGGISADGLTMEVTESSRRRLEGRMNGGGPRVRLETTNGGIRVRTAE